MCARWKRELGVLAHLLVPGVQITPPPFTVSLIVSSSKHNECMGKKEISQRESYICSVEKLAFRGGPQSWQKVQWHSALRF